MPLNKDTKPTNHNSCYIFLYISCTKCTNDYETEVVKYEKILIFKFHYEQIMYYLSHNSCYICIYISYSKLSNYYGAKVVFRLHNLT